MNRAARLALAVTACGLVYDSHAYAAEPKRVAALVVSCIVIAGALTRNDESPAIHGESSRAVENSSRARASWSVRAALAFVSLSALSLAWGRASGALDLATWISGIAFGLAARQMRWSDAIAATRFAGAWLGGAVSFITLASAWMGARGFSLHAGQGNPNWLGLLLAVTLPLALDACIVHVRARTLVTVRGVLASALFAVQLPAIYLAHSRVAWVAAAIAGGALGLFLVFAKRGTRARAIARAGATAASLVIVTFALCFPNRVNADEHDAFSDDVPAAHSLHGRTFIWKVSAIAARDALPFGRGLGELDRAFHDAQAHALAALEPGAASRTYENATTAHQEYLQAAIESGPLAALALLLAFILGTSTSMRRGFFGGAAALISCAVLCLGDSPLRQPAIVFLIALVIGASASREDSRAHDSPPRDAPKPIASSKKTKIALAALLAIEAWCLVTSTRAWLGTRAYLASFEADPESRRALLTKSIHLDESAGEARFERGLLLLAAGDSRAALSDFDDANARMADPSIFIAMGQAELEREDTAAAEHDYRAALAWNPGSLRGRVGLAETLRREGRLDEAEAAARVAHKISPGHPRVQDLLDKIHEEKTDESHDP